MITYYIFQQYIYNNYTYIPHFYTYTIMKRE